MPSKHSVKVVELFYPSKHSEILTNLKHTFSNFWIYYPTWFHSATVFYNSGAALACFLLKAVSCFSLYYKRCWFLNQAISLGFEVIGLARLCELQCRSLVPLNQSTLLFLTCKIKNGYALWILCYIWYGHTSFAIRKNTVNLIHKCYPICPVNSWCMDHSLYYTWWWGLFSLYATCL